MILSTKDAKAQNKSSPDLMMMMLVMMNYLVIWLSEKKDERTKEIGPVPHIYIENFHGKISDSFLMQLQVGSPQSETTAQMFLL